MTSTILGSIFPHGDGIHEQQHEVDADPKGFWLPHSSTIDFCEANYRRTPYIAEWSNTLSSLSLIFFGIYGIYGLIIGGLSNKHQYRRFIAAFLCLVVVGIGSFGLHGTLHQFWQYVDEVPMMLSNLVSLFILKGPLKSSKHEWIWKFVLSGIGIYVSTLYIFYSDYALFFFAYGSGVICTVLGCIYRIHVGNSWNYPLSNQKVGCQLFYSSSVLFSVAFIAWITENAMCPMYPELFRDTFNLHILWHVLASFACYNTTLFLLVQHMDKLGIKVEDELDYLWYTIPSIRVDEGKKTE